MIHTKIDDRKTNEQTESQGLTHSNLSTTRVHHKERKADNSDINKCRAEDVNAI